MTETMYGLQSLKYLTPHSLQKKFVYLFTWGSGYLGLLQLLYVVSAFPQIILLIIFLGIWASCSLQDQVQISLSCLSFTPSRVLFPFILPFSFSDELIYYTSYLVLISRCKF